MADPDIEPVTRLPKRPRKEMHDEIAATVTINVKTAADEIHQVIVMTNAITRAKLNIELVESQKGKAKHEADGERLDRLLAAQLENCVERGVALPLGVAVGAPLLLRALLARRAGRRSG